MRIRVDCPGVPNGMNPQTWPFPTAGLVAYDPVGGTAIFEIPDVDAPPNPPVVGSADRPNTPLGDVVIGHPTLNKQQWLAQLKARYPMILSNVNQPPTIK